MNAPYDSVMYPEDSFREDFFRYVDSVGSWNAEAYSDIETNNHYETRNTFNSLGNVTDPNQTVQLAKKVIYDNANKIVSRQFYARKASESAGTLVNLDSFFYAGENLFNRAYWELNAEGNWVQISSTLYQYDGQGRFIESTLGYLKPGKTSYEAMKINDFDPQNRPVSVTYFRTEANAQTGILSTEGRDAFYLSYDNMGRIREIVNTFFYQGQEIPFTKGVFYSSGAQRRVDSIYYYSYEGEDELLSIRTSFHFSSNGKLEYVLDQEYVNGIFQNDTKKVYSKILSSLSDVSSDEKDTKVYPNPSEGSFTIVCPSIKIPFEYEIYNMVGERLLYGISTDNVVTLKTDLKSGIYFLKVGDTKNTEMLRISIR